MGVAVIGFGYWGPNLARNIQESQQVSLVYICELSEDLHQLAANRHPQTKITSSFEQVLNDPSVKAVLVATPPDTHFPLAMKALRADKHVLVEKPMAKSTKECRLLMEEAHKRNLVLMVDHTFAYTGAVKKMKALAANDLGELQYYDSVRINLGLFQRETNVLWDLAVHDLAILDNVTGIRPVTVSATGLAHMEGYPVNTAYITIFYDVPFIAHIHCSWMAPVKIRRTLLGGSRKMIIYDDLEPTEKIKVYDKGITINPTPAEKYDMRIDYRTADVLSPKLDGGEALSALVEEFSLAIRTGIPPVTDAASGLRVVSILEAADQSLRLRGTPVELSTHEE
jgi:predicted dehydrogenase